MADPKNALRLLNSISKISDVINTKKLNYSSRMDRILSIILEYMGVEQGSIMVLEKKKKLVVHAASRPELIGVEQPLDKKDSISAWVGRSGAPEFIKDISKDARFSRKGGVKKRSDQYKTKSLLSAPILQEKNVIGVINITDKCGERDLLKEDITYLLNFSSLILALVVQKKLNEEVKNQRTTLRKRNKELRRQEALQAELSRMLIHDLKGPLSEVVANLDILSYTISDDGREFLEAAQLACDRTVRMASNLGSVAKIEDGKMKLIKEEVEPMALLEESIVSIKGLAKIKNVELVLEREEGLPSIMMDKVLILRVLQNLLTNALGYSLEETKISLGCYRHPIRKKLIFFVRDQGPGMSEAEQGVIFEKYARISDKQDALVGTGLGLYFCKLAILEHRGKIGSESALGRGSRFHFSLPMK